MTGPLEGELLEAVGEAKIHLAAVLPDSEHSEQGPASDPASHAEFVVQVSHLLAHSHTERSASRKACGAVV